MNIIELGSAEEFKTKILPYYDVSFSSSFFAPMYHGTDISLLGISTEERQRINTACENVINCLYDFCIEKGIDKDKRIYEIRDEYGCLANAIQFAQFRRNKRAQYQYGELYITNGFRRAVGYSKIAWILGETGWNANMLYEGIMKINSSIPSGLIPEENLTLFMQRKEKGRNPVILALTRIPITGVLTDRGEEPDDFFIDITYERNSAMSYKLKRGFDLSAINIYLIREEHFNDCIDVLYE